MAADGSRRYGRDVESTEHSEIRRRVQPFSVLMSADAVDLDERAFTLSAVLQPELDVTDAQVALDQLAADCPTPTRDGVISYLFGAGMFVGDRSNYHDWRNSCLDQVVATRRGMPITLAVVAVEVARRVGVQLAGVGMPGHFLVGDPHDREWFADPFHARTGLAVADCRELLVQMGVSRWSDRFLEPTPDRLIIARMLNNLKLSCERRGDLVQLALVMQARTVIPEFAAEHDDAVRALAILN